MRRLSLFFVFFFLIFASASAQNIWGLLSSNPTYSLLRLELNRKAPGLVSLFTSSTSNVTLFAPVEEAMYDSVAYFSSSPQTEVARIFSYHTVAGALPTSYIATQYVLPSMLLPDSLGGRPQRLLISADTATPPNIRVNTSLIINPDTMANNGIVHGIDTILWPPNVTVYDTLVARQPAQFTTLIGALNSLGLDVTLKSNGGWTLFAPTDSAFAQFQAAQPAVYQAIVSHPPTLTKFLTYHMSSTLVYAGELPLENSLVKSLEGSNFTISKVTNQMNINGYPVTTTNVLCKNGVLHVIDTLLVPADFVPSLRIIMRGQNLTTMISQMDANGLSALLDDTTQNHTIYAPTNAAFNAVSSVTANVLSYHVTDDVEPLAVLQNGELEFTHVRLASLLGSAQVVKVSRDANNTIYINNAKVLSGDYTASNGIVHIIDQVMTLPSDLPTLLRSNPNLSTLTSLLNSSGLLTSAIASDGLSLFAPTNAAFSLVDNQVMRYLGKPLATPVLQNLLAYHVINGSTAGQQIYYAKNVPSGANSITMLSGEAALFNKTNTAVNINSKANVISVDTLAANGVLHTVDAVVVPPSFVFDLQKALVGVDATSFLSLVSNSSLASLLTGNTSYTIFAPTNAALAALQSVPTGDALLNLLQYHFVAGTVMGNSLTNAQVVPTLLFPAGLGGAAQVLRVNITSGAVYVNSANITMSNNTAINGVVHVIDRVLTPPSDVGTILASTPSFSTYNTLLQASGLASLVTGVNSTNVTVFAPENGGFGLINSFVVQYLQRPSMLPILRNIVQYHIALSSVLYSVNIPMGASNVTVANNLVVTVVKTANSITVNGINVTRPDILASNGVVHAVRGLILPPNLYDFGLIRALNAVNATAFLDAADTANVTPLLVTSQKRTVFAPSNKAFSAVDIMPTGDALVSLLKYHLVNGSFVTSQLQDRMLLLSNLNLTSLRGNAQRLRITIDSDDGSVAVNNATILIHNEVASNGVVHVVEKVLFPPLDILSVAGILPQNCSTFVYAAQFAGLATIFKRSALTSFIPTNQAFRGLPKNLLKYLLLGPVAAQDLNAFVTYHLINQFLIYSQDFPVQGTYTTQQGQPLVLGRITGPMGRRILKANDANVVTSALAANGVIHVLDEVLIPPFFQFTLDKLLLALDSELFRAYLTKAKLQEYILSTDPVTFFVPTDNAFIEDTPNLSRLQRNELVQLMANHIVRGKYDNIEPGDRLLTLSGKTLIVSGDENSNTLYVTLEGNVKAETLAVIVGGSVNPALNGDVYQISHVLMREGNEHLEPGTIASIVLLSLLGAVVLVGFTAYVYKQIKDPSYHQL